MMNDLSIERGDLVKTDWGSWLLVLEIQEEEWLAMRLSDRECWWIRFDLRNQPVTISHFGDLRKVK